MNLIKVSVLLCFCFSTYAQDSTSQVKPIDESIGTSDTVMSAVPSPELRSDSKSKEYQAIINRGRALTTTGLTLHFIGLGVSTIMSLASNGSEGANVISIVTGIMEAAGPIMACSGASSVDSKLHQMNVSVPESYGWREYAAGWGFVGAGAGVIVGGSFMVNGSSTPLPGIILIFGGAALAITGEVKWIKAAIHSALYLRKASDKVSTNYSFSLVPYSDFKGRYGMVAQLGF